MVTSLPSLTKEESERRLPVWSILADTFLDTWFDDSWYDTMAAQLGQSGYSTKQLEWMYRNEVAPAFAFNLLDIAGEWAGWNEDFVRARVLKKRGSIYGKLTLDVFLCGHVDKEWDKFRRRLESHRVEKTDDHAPR